jgi:hypothetical protein
MDVDPAYFKERKEKAETIYKAQREIYCPYFQTKVILNSDGFHHLQFSARRERDKKVQLLKFNLLPLALEVIRKAGTVQEYRKLLTPIGKPSARDGSVPMKEVEYWGLVAIVKENNVKVRVILRKVGTGNVTFWSVMPDVKWKNGKQKLSSEGIGDE